MRLQVLVHDIFFSVFSQLRRGHLEYRRVGMYAKNDAPAVGPPGNGNSYIDVNGTDAFIISFHFVTCSLERPFFWLCSGVSPPC
jgi:hypothetical protein